jgi:hypothetical protein
LKKVRLLRGGLSLRSRRGSVWRVLPLLALAVVLSAVSAAPAVAAGTTNARHVRTTSTTNTTAKPSLMSPSSPHASHTFRYNCAGPTRPNEVSCFSIVRTDVKSYKGVIPLNNPSGYGPADLQSAYALPPGGSGQTVAIVDAYDDPNAESDLAVYRSQYGLPACTTANGCFKKVDENGGTNYPSRDTLGWAGEISLDVDMVSATCPNCHILLVEANQQAQTDVGTSVNTAVRLGAKFVSNSYGWPESSSDPSLNASYFNHPGVAITAASGDYGYGVFWPADSPYVTSVGGTTLTRGGGTRGWTETAWSGAGSGCSAYDAKPSWQTDPGCSMRTIADVSAVADLNTGVAVYQTYEGGGWQVYGGTSVASPIIASVYALAGIPVSGTYPASYLYAHQPSGLNDVTSGSNGTCNPSYLCTAGPGYDGPTGLGTPNGITAFNGTWGRAEEVPGTNTLNAYNANVYSVSCASAGNCSAGGYFSQTTGRGQAFVSNEVNGAWQPAMEVPGTATLNTGGNAYVTSVSCATAGNCSAGGNYVDTSSNGQAFVVSEVNGAWQPAVKMPGIAPASITSVSCASVGNCSGGGSYFDASRNLQAFVANEVNGAWQNATPVPGAIRLNVGKSAGVTSVSCATAGNCSAGGTYYDASGNGQAFVANEVNGAWQPATEVPGTATLNTGGNASATSVSCATAGNCSAGGTYSDGSGNGQAFVANEVNGAWQPATEVPAIGTLNTGGNANFISISCAAPGNCSAGGYYYDGYYINASTHRQAFVVNEVNGAWQAAVEVPGTATLNTGGNAGATSVSCTSVGNCSAGGSYYDTSNKRQAFVVNEVNGTWQAAVEAPGTATLNTGGSASINSVSCVPGGYCSAGGGYYDAYGDYQVFVISSI